MARQFAINSGVRYRHSVSPAFWPEADRPGDLEDIFTPTDFDPSFSMRNAFWMAEAPKLALQAARAAIAHWGGRIEDITHIVTTSTSGWSGPGISAGLIHALGLSLDTQKQELNFNGCFCGASCLRVGRDMVRAGDAKAVLVVAVEIASIYYDPQMTDVSSLIAAALFADGAAAFILAPEGDWAFEASGTSLVPDTADMLCIGPDTQGDRSPHRLFLDGKIGARLATYFREERGAGLLADILARCDGELPALAVHPGGPAILEAVRSVFGERGWPLDALQPSIDTLHDTGNLASAAVLTVLARHLPQVESDRVAIFAFGPGLTVEWALIRRKERNHS